MTKQAVKHYKNIGAFEKDADKMQKKGWKIANQSSHKEHFKIGKGCCLGFIFLPLMIFGRGKSSIIATYEKEEGENGKD